MALVTNESALVERARLGDGQSFRTIFDLYAPPLRRFLRDLLGDESSADEATQETFVRAHSRLKTMREVEKLAPWLFGIARNVSYEQMRARRRHRDDPSALEREVDRGPTPEAALLGGEIDHGLAVALADLSDDRRTALLLRIDHGLAYEEIAAVMQWPLAKVKNEIHRARLVLRSQLMKFVGGVA